MLNWFWCCSLPSKDAVLLKTALIIANEGHEPCWLSLEEGWGWCGNKSQHSHNWRHHITQSGSLSCGAELDVSLNSFRNSFLGSFSSCVTPSYCFGLSHWCYLCISGWFMSLGDFFMSPAFLQAQRCKEWAELAAWLVWGDTVTIILSGSCVFWQWGMNKEQSGGVGTWQELEFKMQEIPRTLGL